jgi:phosphopantetheinyl transferase
LNPKDSDNLKIPMPLYKTITVSTTTRVHIWEITESEKDLASGIFLTPNCQQRFDGMKSELHRRGFLSIRHLLALEGYQDKDLFYDSLGKPHLRDGTYISITHSFTFTGIIVSTEWPVGIDIEKQREKILKIAHKFTPIEEYGSLSDPKIMIRKLTVVWGAKESLYKISSILGLSFLNNINIEDFSMEAGETTGVITINGTVSSFKIYFLELEGFTCAYALEPGNNLIR